VITTDPPRCRKCDRRLWKSRGTDIGPKCRARELAASRDASPPAVLPPKRRLVPVSQAARTRNGKPFPGQTELELNQEGL
jgi:hypothetical protein